MHKQPIEIIAELKDKFVSNLTEWNGTDHAQVEKAFLLARAISEIGQILNGAKLQKHRSKCCGIFDEVFLDTISAVYLSICAIDNPARIVMRRVIEMGIAILYLWDLPHMYYAWENQGEDLSFSEMLAHINTSGYRQHVASETNLPIVDELISTESVKSYYRKLSDVVHGRNTLFEVNLPDRFSFNLEKSNNFLEMAIDILEMLLKAYFIRFDLRNDIIKRIPALQKI